MNVCDVFRCRLLLFPVGFLLRFLSVLRSVYSHQIWVSIARLHLTLTTYRRIHCIDDMIWYASTHAEKKAQKNRFFFLLCFFVLFFSSSYFSSPLTYSNDLRVFEAIFRIVCALLMLFIRRRHVFVLWSSCPAYNMMCHIMFAPSFCV